MAEYQNTLLSLADYSLVGLVNHSKVPLLVMLIGIASATTMTMLTSIVYLVLKLMYWDSLSRRNAHHFAFAVRAGH